MPCTQLFVDPNVYPFFDLYPTYGAFTSSGIYSRLFIQLLNHYNRDIDVL